jgi:hypothetical protein
MVGIRIYRKTCAGLRLKLYAKSRHISAVRVARLHCLETVRGGGGQLFA